MNLRVVPVVLTLLMYCSASAHADEVDYRLPKTTLIEQQSIELNLDPTRDGFSGSTTLLLTVTEPVERLGLYWVGLNVSGITLVHSVTGPRMLEPAAGDYDMWWLSDGEIIAPGTYRLSLDFEGDYSRDALGLYKSNFGGSDYLFTQFEEFLARRMAPMVDEPDSKIPWQLTITAPKGLKVASNTPVEVERLEGDQITRVFKQTPPMPSYLLALTVGDFDVTPIEGLSVPGSIYSPKGTGDDTGFAIARTPEILRALEDYFGRSLPYEKLDFVAAPDFAFGAMENVGLVVYRMEYLLLGDNPSGSAAAWTASVIAHEIAHMWYGNLVTMEWWNDLWLNEAFATWMEEKISAQLYPQYDSALNLPQASALASDSLSASKPIQREIRGGQDVLEQAGLTYTKGHAILNMLEEAIGEADFQRAIQRYMEAHAWGNTVAADLWSALEAETEVPVQAIADTFLGQAGFPVLYFSEDGTVTQRRFSRLGVDVDPQQWLVPVATRYRKGDMIFDSSFMLDEVSTRREELEDAEWILPGAGGNGYYVWYTGDAQYNALLADFSSITDREKAGVLANSSQLLTAGLIEIDKHLNLLGTLVNEDNMTLALDGIEGIRSIALKYRGSELDEDLRRFVTERLTPWYTRLGTEIRSDDSDAARNLRPRVLRTLAEYGENSALIEEMASIAAVYLADPDSVNPRLGREALRINAMFNGDAKMAERYINAYGETTNATLRINLTRALYFQGKPAISAVFKALEAGAFSSGDMINVISGLFYANDDQALLYAEFDHYFDSLVEKIPENYAIDLPRYGYANCRADNLALRAAFYEDKGDRFSNSLLKAQESTQTCLDIAARGRPAMTEFLKTP